MKSGKRTHLIFLMSSGTWAFACIQLNKLPADDEGGAGNASAGLGGVIQSGAGGALAGRGGGTGAHAGQSTQAGAGQAGGNGGSGGMAESGAGGSLVGTGGGGMNGNGGSAGLEPLGGGGSDSLPNGGAGIGGTSDAGSANAGTAQGGTTNGGAAGAAGDDGCDLFRQDPDNPPSSLNLSGNLWVHDPVVIAAHDRYYLFHTGSRVPVKTSTNLTAWTDSGTVFITNPSWISTQVPGSSDLWAPDISYFGGLYHLYYSVSTFGSNRSCIGHATRAALDSGSWTDHGPVICSNPIGGPSHDWNAIDGNVILDEEGTPWLSFGSFWSGIKMIELDEDGARANQDLHSLATRVENGGSVEAPFIVRRCDAYYLFVSFDFCCRGSQSTYRIMVGRSENLLGPYLDRSGKSMLEGGGTLVLQADTRWRGPGHNAVFIDGDAAYNVYHAYDSQNLGRATLRISELVWDASGWPLSDGP